MSRALVVDDDRAVRKALQVNLTKHGIDVTLAETADEALGLLHGAPFDLLLTDYTMPRMTGLDLAQALRAIRPELPVILYSGYTDVIPEPQLGRVAVELVQKPIDPEALLAALTKHL